MQLYRSKRFCFSFSQRHQTQLVCLVRFVSCPRTVVWAQARRVYLSGTWAYRFHVERACKWDRNSSRGVTMIIPSRSLPTIQPIYRSLLFDLSHAIQEKFDKNFSFPLLLWMQQSRFAFETFAIEFRLRRTQNFESLSIVVEVILVVKQDQDQDRCIDKITSLQLFAYTERYLHT